MASRGHEMANVHRRSSRRRWLIIDAPICDFGSAMF
jgi:hypothetical protein